ncbi:RluA family pseudouridine synthase [Paracoccus pacificus]|uniref:Pseudouridine synthase n=1 Tax=Paracoccus pacificus TaxID=1463598 RepID=A0ABW4R9Z0_9RHOB
MSDPLQILRLTIPADPPDRLDKALASLAPAEAALSRSRLSRLLAEGAVTDAAGTVIRNGKARVAEGEEYRITLPAPEPVEVRAEAIPLNVVYEDDELIVIDKAAGMVVHPAPGAAQGTLVNALLHHCGDSLSGIGGERRPGIVHRIDKDTTGLMVAAKSDRAHQGLARQFEAHSVHRRYLAAVHGAVDPADPRLRGLSGVQFEPGGILRIATMLGRHPTDRQRQAVSFDHGRHAVTRARTLRSFGNPTAASLIECWLETGRTHQIRVHMTYAGLGLIGDPVYGGNRRASVAALGQAAVEAMQSFPRQALHAAELGFVHPVTGAEMRFASDLPDDFAALVHRLEGEGNPAP